MTPKELIEKVIKDFDIVDMGITKGKGRVIRFSHNSGELVTVINVPTINSEELLDHMVEKYD